MWVKLKKIHVPYKNSLQTFKKKSKNQFPPSIPLATHSPIPSQARPDKSRQPRQVVITIKVPRGTGSPNQRDPARCNKCLCARKAANRSLHLLTTDVVLLDIISPRFVSCETCAYLWIRLEYTPASNVISDLDSFSRTSVFGSQENAIEVVPSSSGLAPRLDRVGGGRMETRLAEWVVFLLYICRFKRKNACIQPRLRPGRKGCPPSNNGWPYWSPMDFRAFICNINVTPFRR